MEQENSVEQSLEDSVADFIHGKQPEEAQEEEYQPDPKPVQEGEEFDGEEVTEEEEPEEVEAKEDELDVVEIEVDGEILEVPAKYKDYFLRQQDYTKKTQDLAEQRKTTQLQLDELRVARERFEFAESIQEQVMEVQQQQQLAQQYQEYLKNNLEDLSSVEIERLRLAISESKDKAQEIQQGLQQKYGEFQQAQEQSRAELLKRGTEILSSKIPGWGEETQNQLREYALSHGYSEEEVSSLIDPRQVETLWKASQYDALKSGAAKTVKKVRQAPEIKPKTRNPMPDDVKQKLNLRKKLKSQNLSQAEKASMIGEDIAGRFFTR